MNPYEAHAESLAQLQTELGVPINGKIGGQIVYSGVTVPAIVGVFEVQQRLRPDGSGFSPFITGTIWLLKSLCLPAWTFHSGQQMTVTAPGCAARACKIFTIEDKFTFWQIVVDDQSQAA
jgi:hypothetical protein